MGLKGRRAGATGKRKWFVEIFSGADWSRALQRFVLKRRVIDRENDRYTEHVFDPHTQTSVHDVDEPLSEHICHGSAEPTRKGGEQL